MTRFDPHRSHPLFRHRPARPLLRTAVLALLAVKLVIDILQRAFGRSQPMPRKLVYVNSFARRLPIRGRD